MRGKGTAPLAPAKPPAPHSRQKKSSVKGESGFGSQKDDIADAALYKVIHNLQTPISQMGKFIVRLE